MSVTFTDPPVVRSGRQRKRSIELDDVAAQPRMNPGRWARVLDSGSRDEAHNMRRSMRMRGMTVTVRANAAGRKDVYARFEYESGVD